MSEFIIKTSGHDEAEFAEIICKQMEESAQARGTGIARRSPSYVRQKMEKGDAFVALEKNTLSIAGFCYIEMWSHGKYIANSGLIIFPDYRGFGLASLLKEFAFQESRRRFPEAKLFGLTTSSAVMHVNSELGYRPVTYESLTLDQEFWQGCQSCVNYPTLLSKEKKNCFCTAMLYDPERQRKKAVMNTELEIPKKKENRA
jgi:GNAT superfamily N-acetyltransferase